MIVAWVNESSARRLYNARVSKLECTGDTPTKSTQQRRSLRQENKRMSTGLVRPEPRPEARASSRSNRKWGGSTR